MNNHKKIAIIGTPENLSKAVSAITHSLCLIRNNNESLLIEKSYYNLHKLTDDKDKLVDKGLFYFKKRYEESPFQYPGTCIYINLITDCVGCGMTIKEAYKTSIAIIDYEFNMLTGAYANGVPYSECYDFSHPILKAHINEFRIIGLSASKAGESLAELCKAFECLPKKQKPKYKSWERPYKFHR